MTSLYLRECAYSNICICSEIQSTSQVRKHCEVPSTLHCKLYLEYCLPGLKPVHLQSLNGHFIAF